MRKTAIDRLTTFKLFAPDDYYALHPDVATHRMDPVRHAIEYGAHESRSLFAAATVLSRLAAVDPAIQSHRPASQATVFPEAVHILVSSFGNIYMNEIAELLAAEIRDAGVDCVVATENSDMSDVDPRSAIIVAPHEFFTQGKGPSWLVEGFVTQCIVLNVEQAQTPWFGAGLIPMLLARGVADLSVQMTAVWDASGRPAFHYEPSARMRPALLDDRDRAHPLIEALPDRIHATACRPVTERPIDVSFFGTRSDRRDRAFARFAPRLAPYLSYVYFRQRPSGPILPGSSEANLLRISDYIISRSKIALNIHRDDIPYFEWHRMVQQGMALGALVVSDGCLPHPHFKPNEHFLQDEVRQVPNLIEWVLNTPDGRIAAERIVSNVERLFNDDDYRKAKTAALLHFLSTAGS